MLVPNAEMVPVPFEVNVQTAFTVRPDQYSVSAARVGVESSMKFTVRGSGNRPFKITAIDGLGDGLDLAEPLSAEAKTIHIFTVKCKPTAAGPIQKKLSIRVEGEKDPVATINVEGAAS